MKEQKKGRFTTAAILLLFLAGLSLLLYPAVSSYWNAARQTSAILAYDTAVSQMREEESRQLLEEAEAFNRSLLNRPSPYGLTEEQAALYPDTLLSGSGDVIACLEIPSIGVSLPICHGTDSDTLQKAVGHLEWSSLPVGGESTHCVLSGHRGLPSSELLTNIDHLENGDVFYIQTLGRRLEYQVDQIAVVEPDDYSLLGIEPGQDHVTLLTCTPYGINSHRLLVRGTRTGTETAGESGSLNLPGELRVLDTKYVLTAALLAAGVIVFAGFLFGGSGKRKNGRRERI